MMIDQENNVYYMPCGDVCENAGNDFAAAPGIDIESLDPAAPGYEELGCFIDSRKRVLTARTVVDETMTTEVRKSRRGLTSPAPLQPFDHEEARVIIPWPALDACTRTSYECTIEAALTPVATKYPIFSSYFRWRENHTFCSPSYHCRLPTVHASALNHRCRVFVRVSRA